MCDPYTPIKKEDLFIKPTDWNLFSDDRTHYYFSPVECLHTVIRVNGGIAICDRCGVEIKDIEKHLKKCQLI